MICEKCGHEMLLKCLSEFYTEYECPICGHTQIAGDLQAMAEDEEDQELDNYDPTDDIDECDIYGHEWESIEGYMNADIAQCRRCGLIDEAEG